MAVKIVLGVGDGEPTDKLDMSEWVVAGGIVAPPPDRGAKTRTIQLVLDIDGASADAMWTLWQSVEMKIQQAREARRNRAGSGVSLSIKLDTTNWVYFDVLDGSLELN